jgi:hypothetical protein
MGNKTGDEFQSRSQTNKIGQRTESYLKMTHFFLKAKILCHNRDLSVP